MYTAEENQPCLFVCMKRKTEHILMNGKIIVYKSFPLGGSWHCVSGD